MVIIGCYGCTDNRTLNQLYNIPFKYDYYFKKTKNTIIVISRKCSDITFLFYGLDKIRYIFQSISKYIIENTIGPYI